MASILTLFPLACATPKHNLQMASQNIQSVDYLVLAKDAVGIGDGLMRLASAHWDYIDHFSPTLVARGPVLSPDGLEHTGSIHIITSANSLTAQRFANEEPYYRAGFYSSVTVTPFRNLLGQTMWERTPSVPPEYSTFLVANWQNRSCTTKQIEQLQAAASTNKRWVFLGLLLSPDGSCIGIAAAADLRPETAESALRGLLERGELPAVSIKLSRWRRGGRQ
jgi:hypothetical protein